jgi:K+-transporting ATPase c subunit
MTANGWFQILLYFGAALVVTKPLGMFLYRVFEGKPTFLDFATTSGSGLDPDISPASAEFQAPRVAKARGISVDDLRLIVRRHTQGRQYGIFGEPRVNVLELNLVLDEMAGVTP